MKIIVGSNNPTKITAVQNAFVLAFPNESVHILGSTVQSGVSEQPMTSEETFQGAKNRSKSAKQLHIEADFWVGIESGLEQSGNVLKTFHWVFILSNNKSGYAKSGMYYLPEKIATELHDGKDLGSACNKVFNRNNTGTTDGITGILTHGVINRAHYHQDTVTLALIPFINTDLYMTND